MRCLYDIFKEFVTYDLSPRQIPGYQDISINRMGYVYNACGEIKPYVYRDDEHYDSIYVKDVNGKPHVIGLHQAISMTFDPDYYNGCIVHHKDENKYHNWATNLEVTDRKSHFHHHHPNKYKPIKMTCQVCGNIFVWSSERQQRYYSDLRRGKVRIITCSKSCSSYYGRMTQLNKNINPDVAE